MIMVLSCISLTVTITILLPTDTSARQTIKFIIMTVIQTLVMLAHHEQTSLLQHTDIQVKEHNNLRMLVVQVITSQIRKETVKLGSLRLLVKNNIRRDTELFALPKVRKNESQIVVAHFILTKSSKNVNELIEESWKMQDAAKKLDWEKRQD